MYMDTCISYIYISLHIKLYIYIHTCTFDFIFVPTPVGRPSELGFFHLEAVHAGLGEAVQAEKKRGFDIRW